MGGWRMREQAEYWLKSDQQDKIWGPFETEHEAWRHLFGRESDETEREQHIQAGWHVGSTNLYGGASDAA